MVTNRERILRELYKNLEGLGHNELREVIHEKSLRRWLPELEKNRLIEIKKVKVKGGTKHLHKLTLKGIEFVQRNLLCESFLKTLLDVYETHPRSIDTLQEFAQNMLDEIYGKGEVIAFFMTRSQYLDFQEWFKKNRDGVVRWRTLPEDKGR